MPMKFTGRGFNHLPAVIRAVDPSAAKMVEKITEDIAAGAGATAPIATGALAASYKADTEGLKGQAGSNIEYAPYVEYGTINSSAQPHLVPAAIRVIDQISPAAKSFGVEIEKAARNG